MIITQNQPRILSASKGQRKLTQSFCELILKGKEKLSLFFLILSVQKDPPNLWKHLLIVRPEMISLTASMLWFEPNSRISIICLLIFIRMKLFTGGKRWKYTASKNYRDLWQHLYTSRKSKIRQHQPFSPRRACPRLCTPPTSHKRADRIGQEVFEDNSKQKNMPSGQTNFVLL